MNKFKFMQPVAVSDVSENCAIGGVITNTCSYYYLFTCKDGRHAIRWERKSNGDEGTATYKYVVAIPEKKKVPYTFETFPKCHSLLRISTRKDHIWTIDKRWAGGIITTDHTFYFAETYDDLSLSFDSGETWVPFWLEG